MNITIIGSGSAGLFTALTFSNILKNSKIKIIRNPKIGVIGVGEATVGSFPNQLEKTIGLNKDIFLFHLRPIVKYGIWFNFGNSDFHYPFDYTFDKQYDNDELPNGFNIVGGNFGHSEYSKRMLNKYPKFADSTSPAYHLINTRLIKYLEETARHKGIEIIDDEITSIERDGDNVISLNNKYKSDYFIDCSGFKSLLNTSKWVDYGKYLVNNKAIFFRYDITDPRPYTKASTMPNGWLWEIDHEDECGCGYVYSSKYVSDKQALIELEEKMGFKINDYKIIPFKSGRHEKHWIGNTISIGNADAFVEPLESTGIMGFLTMAGHVSEIIKYGKNKGDLIERYNDFVNKYYDNIRDFILCHFCFNQKLDTKYWQDCRKRASIIPDGQGKEILKYYLTNNTHIKFRTEFYSDLNPFNLEGWYSIFRGLEVEKQIKIDEHELKLITS